MVWYGESYHMSTLQSFGENNHGQIHGFEQTTFLPRFSCNILYITHILQSGVRDCTTMLTKWWNVSKCPTYGKFGCFNLTLSCQVHLIDTC